VNTLIFSKPQSTISNRTASNQGFHFGRKQPHPNEVKIHPALSQIEAEQNHTTQSSKCNRSDINALQYQLDQTMPDQLIINSSKRHLSSSRMLQHIAENNTVPEWRHPQNPGSK
jgi:hypothetical protein